MRKLKPRPTFKSETQEAAYWASHDSTEYIDYSKSRRMIFPKLKPSTETSSRKIAFGCPARQGGEEKGLLPEAAPIL